MGVGSFPTHRFLICVFSTMRVVQKQKTSQKGKREHSIAHRTQYLAVSVVTSCSVGGKLQCNTRPQLPTPQC